MTECAPTIQAVEAGPGETRAVVDDSARPGRYEFRVWGDHAEASSRLASVAEFESADDVADCYLLVPDPSCNAKIRRRRLKVKRLIDERFGFQRWSTQWHRVPADAPAPFEGLLSELDRRRDDLGSATGDDGDVNSLVAEITGLADVIAGMDHRQFLPVFVAKHRRRYRRGSVRAEAVDVKVGGRDSSLCTVAIEGRDLDDLIRLRSDLGLDLASNVALHVALDPQSGF